MTESTGPQAGGILLALGVAIGAVAGTLHGQPTIGVLAGTGAGSVLALGFWLRDRRRG